MTEIFKSNDDKFEEIMIKFLSAMRRDSSNLIVGENISSQPELKIIFEGYEKDEDDEDILDSEVYSFFVHKDSALVGFVFPEHESSPWSIIHRPEQEAWFKVSYDVPNDSWAFYWYPDNNSDNDTELTEEEIINSLEKLNQKYFAQ